MHVDCDDCDILEKGYAGYYVAKLRWQNRWKQICWEGVFFETVKFLFPLNYEIEICVVLHRITNYIHQISNNPWLRTYSNTKN